MFLDRTAKVWDLNTSEEILSLAQHKRDVSVVKFVPGNKLAITVYQSTIKVNSLSFACQLCHLMDHFIHSSLFRSLAVSKTETL